MKKTSSIKVLLRNLCSFFVALAPIIIRNDNCILLWGKPECPDILKELYPDK